MTLAQFQAMITKYGWDRLLCIIFDNSRVWNCIRRTRDTKGDVVKTNGLFTFVNPTEFITLDTTNELISILEPKSGVSYEESNKYAYEIVNPIECIQGLNFIPLTITSADAIYTMKQYSSIHMNV